MNIPPSPFPFLSQGIMVSLNIAEVLNIQQHRCENLSFHNITW
jgi:hypothetical protein